MKRAALFIATAAVALASRTAEGAPSVWQRVREPHAAAQQQALNRVERLLGAVGIPEFDAELSAGAIALSQLGQDHWPCLGPPAPASAPERTLDPRLEYLIGGALLDSQTHREAEARCVLELALRDAPDSPLAAHGLADLAIAAAKLGDRAAEHAAYLRALPLTWEPDSRGNLLSNLAESDMALGNLPSAIREYRAALQTSQQPELLAGAYFGLAVALDRAGDMPSALEAAKRAVSVPLPPSLLGVTSVLDLPNVFFTPAYEVHYYKALGAMAAAELAQDDTARRDALAEAVDQWSAYFGPATAEHGAWAERARLHLGSVARKLVEATAKVAKSAPRARATAPLL